MIETKPPQALSLFDLIGREWALDSPVRQIGFNANGTTVACTLETGGIRLLPMADGEHPEKRIRIEFETGRSTIRPREQPLGEPMRLDETARVDGPGFCQLGEPGFAVVDDSGGLLRVTARGQVVRLKLPEPGPVTALCSLPGEDAVYLAQGGLLTIHCAKTGTVRARADLGQPVSMLALSHDGSRLAARLADGIAVLDAGALARQVEIPCAGTVACLSWSSDGAWIAAGCREARLIVASVARGEADVIEGFPGAVNAAEFSAPANTLIASGAFRAVGWRGPDLPFGDHKGDHVQTGKPGFTLVERVAVNPEKDSCAVGYANGLVTLCQIARTDELMLVEGRGAPVTAMTWSPDGKHLALGFVDGRAAILTFPKIMFK